MPAGFQGSPQPFKKAYNIIGKTQIKLEVQQSMSTLPP